MQPKHLPVVYHLGIKDKKKSVIPKGRTLMSYLSTNHRSRKHLVSKHHATGKKPIPYYP